MMGELILCRGGIAALPYYIEDADLNIYSLEELCYYIENFPDRLDEAFWNEELCQWLAGELSLGELSEQIRAAKQESASMADFVRLVMAKSAYFEPEAKREIIRQLSELENKDEFERGKLKADRYLKNHRYAESILEYRKLLHKFGEEASRTVEIGNIWHNMGVAAARMFLYEQAMEYFEKAYGYNNNPESMREMYYARQCIPGEEKEGGLPKEWKDQVMQALQQAEDAVGEIAVPKEKQIEEWKKRYRVYSRQ